MSSSCVIDLHGMYEHEAIGKIMSGIISLEMGEVYRLEIITGNGSVLTRVVEEALEENNLSWRHENGNTGCYIVEL